MDPTGSRHRRSPSSSDRLLGLFTFSPSPSAAASIAGDELNEAELFWAGDVSETENQLHVSPPPGKNRRQSFDLPQDSGILAVLTEPDFFSGDMPVLRRKPSAFSSSSSSMVIPSMPRPLGLSSQENSREYLAKSMPGGRKFQQSAPVKVPVLSSKAMAARRNAGELAAVDDDDEDDDEMLPPHEIVARGSGVLPNTTFSVLEGVGRTLKGRDLRQVRNAIWRKTGFLD